MTSGGPPRGRCQGASTDAARTRCGPLRAGIETGKVRLDVTDSQRRAPLLAWGVSDLPLGAIAGIAVNAMLETLSGLISCLVRPRDWPIFALTITCPVEQSTSMVQTLAALRSEVPGRLAWRFVEDSSRVLRSPRVTGAGPEAVFPGDPLARLFQADSRAVLSTICRVRTRWLLGPIGLWALAFCPLIKRQMPPPTPAAESSPLALCGSTGRLARIRNVRSPTSRPYRQLSTTPKMTTTSPMCLRACNRSRLTGDQ
jgi:hypothetical protein